jgi:hypothetical protein
MDIDLDTPNAEWPAPPAIAVPAHKQTTRPIGLADCASSSFDLVPEARQTYPSEDDRTRRAVKRGER